MKIMKDKEIALVKEILKKLGASEEDSEFVAEATIDADLKGFTSHGLGRFPQYLISIEAGTINLKDDIEIEKETPAIALINGNSGFGQAVSYKAMQIAIKKAKEVGIGCVGVHNTNHFGVTGFYSDLALRENCIGLVLANTDPAIAPLGGSQALIGTNPIALGIPSETYITVDMATSVTARGKIIESKRKGLDLPDGWALDKDGNPTNDPEAALEGSILPFGGFKGYALSLLIEILTGPLVQAGYGLGVSGTASPTKDCTKGDLYVVIDPSKFGDFGEFVANTEDFVSQVRATGETVAIPGDLEVKRIADAEANGVAIDEKLYEQLKGICDDLDIDIDSYIEE
ncbi:MULTISPECIES: L-sulfolactate dehydrogenase [unclassified Methanobrevibacter]|uniref:L-sulfolactate dehydrogenase n=1 Tax=unclassified Methanobrevibacter TaxID=2638681 RepID=UPI0025FCA12F|nr:MULTISPECIES: L-sulfolactate dehydrogenase [unclassified Methanobrevibacter]MEE0942492.1 L-sulfolactate dehydrogenase [Methanobrevibacter sp.]